MAEVLLFVTGALVGVIVGYLLARRYGRSHGHAGSNERLLEDRLQKADQGLARFGDELEKQKEELKQALQDAQDARERAAVSTTQLDSAVIERERLGASLSEIKAELEFTRKEKETLGRNVSELSEQMRAKTQTIQRLESEQTELKELQRSTLTLKDELRNEKELLASQIAQVAEQLRSQESQTQFLEQARADLLTQFSLLSGQMLDGSREALLKTTKETVSEPFSQQVELLRKQLEQLSKDSSEKLGALAQTTRDLRQRSEDVQGAAQQLTSALRSPNVKGRWGEVNLRRILEFVGLIAYCDFDEQLTLGGHDGVYRPDCVITIPGVRKLIIDSKAPVESYLDAIQATDEQAREAALQSHLRKVRSHIDTLSKKDYTKKMAVNQQVVDGVVLFIPVEGALSMALERDPELLEYAFGKNIILTFPTSLLAILKGLSMTIQQAEMANNIDEIQRNAAELYKKFAIFTDKFNSIGTHLAKLNKSFNEAVGSYERRLLPHGRKIGELSGQSQNLSLTDVIDSNVREVQVDD